VLEEAPLAVGKPPPWQSGAALPALAAAFVFGISILLAVLPMSESIPRYQKPNSSNDS
jgi:hypothetical protein